MKWPSSCYSSIERGGGLHSGMRRPKMEIRPRALLPSAGDLLGGRQDGIFRRYAGTRIPLDLVSLKDSKAHILLLLREAALWVEETRLLSLLLFKQGTRVGRLGCGGTREGVLGRTGAVVASASIATSGRRSGGAAKDERQEDVAGDATARQVARAVRSNLRAPRDTPAPSYDARGT